MKKTTIKIISVILVTVIAAAALIGTSTAAGIAGDVNRDGLVNNKDVVTLFRYISGSDVDVDEIACDTNGDGDLNNKDVVTLFRHVSNPEIKISYGKETTADSEETTEEITETEKITETEETVVSEEVSDSDTESESEEVSDSEEISEEESQPEEPPAEYDNIFNKWDDSVSNTFSEIKRTDLSITKKGIQLKFTGKKSQTPNFKFDVAEYARIMNKPALTGADASYIVVRLKSTTDGDLRVSGTTLSNGAKTASYKPDGEFHYIIVDLSATKVINDEFLSTIRLDWGGNKTDPDAEALITEIGFFNNLYDALDYCAVIAGTDSGIVRDGTPKKYLTMSFDDGITQDLRVIEILKKYHAEKAATFFINTGLCGANWAWVGQSVNRPDVTHLRFTMDELKTGIYDGFDVECHTLNHWSLKKYDDDPQTIKKEILGDCINIFNLTGYYPAGLAWPGGDGDQTETTRKIVYENTNMGFARGLGVDMNSLKTRFKLPTEFLLWERTCSLSNSACLTNLTKFLEKDCTEDMLYYVFAHAYEFDINNSWDIFEEFIKQVSEAVDAGEIVLVSNADFYQLFKDEIPSLLVKE